MIRVRFITSRFWTAAVNTSVQSSAMCNMLFQMLYSSGIMYVPGRYPEVYW